ncbi:hypothetical protein Q8F55_007547 [Vanrija albida]|uniref:Uncharacterized protein n=1 Tax=Vanrija albida TaxID=181172 RepID=A0ABR3PTV1_9TREE
MLFTATSILALAGLAQAQDVLFSASGFRATLYYDLDTTTDICAEKNGGPFASNWAVSTGINSGVTYCQGSTSTAWTLDSLNTNRIVAMNYTMVSGDKEKWCGKEVQIFGADGKEITIDEGPFVLFDGCAACMSTGIIDLSAKAFAAIKGGTCGGNNPEGLTVKVLNNNVSPSGRVGGGSPPASVAPVAASSQAAAATTSAAPAASSSFSVRGANAWWSPSAGAAAATGAPQQLNAAPLPSDDAAPSPSASVSATAAAASPSPDANDAAADASPSPSSEASDAATTTTAAAAAPSSSAAPSPAAPAASSQAAPAAAPSPVSAGSCQFGAWQCNGLKIEVCNFIDTKTVGWETIATCDNECSFTNTGSVICQ